MTLSDLHRHLDGSLRRDTLHELAEAHGVALPDDIRFHAGMGLTAALARFATTLAVLQEPDAVKRVAAEMCDDAAREGVTTLEIRFAPQLHHGAPLADIVDAAVEGAAKRAGILLCGLYGDPPALVEELAEIGATRPGVVGLDLAGGPSPDHAWSLADYQGAFTRARDAGLGRTVHAGEGRPPAEIRVAIEALHAQRIGHGCTLLDDPDVTALVVSRQICVEACPTSNVHTGIFTAVSEHPLVRWLERGVRACVCTDNTLLSDVDAPTELARVAAIPGMTETHLQRVIENGHAARFVR